MNGHGHRLPDDPDPDAVALAAAAATGVLLGSRLAGPADARAGWPAAAWAAGLAGALAVAALVAGAPSARRGGRPRRGPLAGLLVLGVLVAGGAAVAGLRAAAVRDGLLVALAGSPAAVELRATVAEEPRTLPGGARAVTLSVDQVVAGGRAWRIRERAAAVLPGGLGVGDRLRLRARVAWTSTAARVGGRPVVVLRAPVVEARDPPRSRLLRASEALRAGLRRRASLVLPPDRAGLLAGMALGDTSLLPLDLERAFRAAGLTHLMAVSGANVAVVLAAGLSLAGALGAGRPALAACGAVLVVLFTVLTRWEPSVLRAGAMAVLVLLGVATGRGPGGRRALCLAVVVLLLADPALSGALGFRLSAAATAGVLWLGPLAAQALPARLPEPVRAAAGVTLGAQAAALPALGVALGRLSLAALPANLLALPLAACPMLLGVVAAAVEPVAPALATLACLAAEPFLAGLIAVADRAAALPGADLTLAGPVRAVPVLLTGGLVVLARRMADRKRPTRCPRSGRT